MTAEEAASAVSQEEIDGLMSPQVREDGEDGPAGIEPEAAIHRFTIHPDTTAEELRTRRILVKKMRHVEAGIRAETIRPSLIYIDQLYDAYCNPDPTQTNTVSTFTIAADMLSAEKEPATDETREILRLALHKNMMDHPEYFVADSTNLRVSGNFTMRSKNEVSDLMQTSEWSRNRTAEFEAFVNKAKSILAFRRKHPTPEFDTAPRQLEDTTLPTFSATDKTIIRVLKESIRTVRLIQYPVYANVLGAFFKELGRAPYGVEISQVALQLLKDIGVYTPWENLSAIVPRPSDTPAAPKDWPVIDGLDSLRIDRGDQLVYTIDDAGAAELDDGLSIEAAAPVGGQSTWWVHVHVADPTAVLGPQDPISIKAAAQRESIYYSEYNVPLLPHDLVKSGNLSLGSGLEHGPQRVMTFSTRFTKEGEALETDVSPSLIRNVKLTTYDAVDELLGIVESSYRKATLSTRSSPPDAAGPSRLLSKLVASDREALSNLAAISSAALRNRIKYGNYVHWTIVSASARLHKTDQIISSPKELARPLLLTGSPAISLAIPGPGAPLQPEQRQSLANTIVGEMMLQANRACATFAKRHDVSIPYLVQKAPSAAAEGLSQLMAARDPQTGRLDALLYAANRQTIIFPASTIEPEPGSHWNLGYFDDIGYTRATSPLRRYSDLLVHWQIKSAMLQSKPTFSHGGMRSLVSKLYTQTGQSIKRIGKRVEQFWCMYTINMNWQRWLSSPNGPLDEVFGDLRAIVMEAPMYGKYNIETVWHVHIPSLGAPATLTQPTILENDSPYAIGQEVRVRIDRIELDDFPRMLVRSV